jgi:hypothetical protein
MTEVRYDTAMCVPILRLSIILMSYRGSLVADDGWNGNVTDLRHFDVSIVPIWEKVFQYEQEVPV